MHIGVLFIVTFDHVVIGVWARGMTFRARARRSRRGGMRSRLDVLVGPNLVVPFGNGLILGYLMYKSGLVPRRMAWLGMIGGPLLLFGNFGVLFDWWDQTSAVSILAVPEIIWEAFLGIYCAIWGFRRDAPILSRVSPAR